MQFWQIIFILQTCIALSSVYCTYVDEPPSIKIYQVDDRNKVLKVVGDVPDSEVIIEGVERIRLECTASYPIQWIYTGTGVPVLLSNIRKESDDKFTASAFINALSEKHTGKYTCSSTEFQEAVSSYFYIFVPGSELFIGNSVGNTVFIPKNDSHIRIPCATSNPNTLVTLQKTHNDHVTTLEVDNVQVHYEHRTGFKIDLKGIGNPEGIYICAARHNGIYRSVEYIVAKPTKSPASIEQTTPSSAADEKCETHTDCSNPNWSCYTDRTCKDPCLNSIRCGDGAVCKYNDRRPYCECKPDFVGDPAKECFNTLQGSAPETSNPSSTKFPESKETDCRRDQDCQQHEKCLKDHCLDPCKTRLCGRNAFCLTENHISSCRCNAGFSGEANSVAGCGPLRLQRPDPLKSKDGGSDKAVTCQTNRECPADQICRTHVGEHRVCVEVCGTKICGVNSECRLGNFTSDQPSCLCKDNFTGQPYVYCDLISNSRDCVIDNDCQSEERCETGRNYRKCVSLCAKHSCSFNLECEAVDHEVRCICPAGFTGGEQIGCTRDVLFRPPEKLESPDFETFNPAAAPPRVEEFAYEGTLCLSLSCGPFSECRIDGGQPKCFCQSGATGSPPKCKQECDTSQNCPGNKTCVQKRCRSVCRNRCGKNAQCRVGTSGSERIPICQCSSGFTGDPEVECIRV